MRASARLPGTPCATAGDQPSVLVCLGIGGAVFLLALASIAFTRDVGQIAAIWPTNAVIVAMLLRRPPKTWWGFLVAGLAGTLAADLVVGDSPVTTIELSVCSGIEMVLCAGLLRRFVGQDIDLGRQRHLVPFLIVCGGLAPFVSSVGAGLVLSGGNAGSFAQYAVQWFVPDALGLVVVVPAMLALTPAAIRALGHSVRTGRGLLSGLVLAVSLTVVFGQARYPILFLIPPALILVAFELNLAGAALALVVTAFVAVAMTLTGHGSAVLIHGALAERLGVLELFLATMTLAVLPVAAALAKRRHLETDLRTSLGEVETARAAAVEAERLSLLAQAIAGLGHWRRDAKTGQSIWSDQMLQIHGISRADLAVRPGGAITLYHPEDRPKIEAINELTIATGAPFDLTVRLNRADDGAERIVIVKGEAERVDGKVVAIVGVMRDVTSMVLLEAELRAARDAAEASAAIKSDFMANMSHEIRTPLTAIVGFTSLLSARSDLDETARTQVKRVAAAGQALLSIVNDILDFSKLEAGHVEIKPRPVEPDEVLAAAMDLFAPQAAAKGLALVFSAEGDLPPCLLIDPDRMRQILLNLIGNAIKFTEAGSVRVVAAYDAKASKLEVRVEDSGAGLTKAQQRKLFQRFSQVDTTSTRRHGGTGLGLAISKGLAEAMGGEIGVRSRPGHGSVFYFRIAAPVATPVAEIAPPTLLTQVETPLDGSRLLVVDDNPVNRELVRAILSPIGVEVTDAVDGLAAVETAKSTPFDVILMDIRMPGLDGPAATAKIRKRVGPNRDIPILAFSADVDVAEFEGATSVFNGVVRKPISPGDLVATVSRCLQRDDSAQNATRTLGYHP